MYKNIYDYLWITLSFLSRYLSQMHSERKLLIMISATVIDRQFVFDIHPFRMSNLEITFNNEKSKCTVIGVIRNLPLVNLSSNRIPLEWTEQLSYQGLALPEM